jgi:uncharacterized protein (TIGR03435 family)
VRRAVLWVAFACVVYGQSAAFEAASVKPAAQSGGHIRPSMRGGPGTADPGRIIYANVTLMAVLLRAYDALPYQISGPDWLGSEHYDLTATIPAGSSREQFRAMLQQLLTDRFRLTVHHETRQLQGYVLGRGKAMKLKWTSESGADVEPVDAPKQDSNGFPELDAPGLVLMEAVRGKTVVTLLTARAQPIAALADRLSREFRMPVKDETRLEGKFDFKLEFALGRRERWRRIRTIPHRICLPRSVSNWGCR